MAKSKARRASSSQGKMGLPIKMTIISVVSAVIVEIGLLAALVDKGTNWKLAGSLAAVLPIFAGLASYFFALTITKPLKDIINYVLDLADGNYRKRNNTKASGEVAVLANAVSELSESLREAKQSMKVVSEIQEELNLASEIQGMLLPQRNPKVPTLDIYPYYEPAGDLGGDYYDFIPVTPEHLGLIIADVSGKGITGSMIMGLFRSTLRRFAENNTSTREVLIKTNEHLSNDIPSGMFVTAYYIVYHIPTNQITFSCAGHTKMVIHRAMSGSIELVKPNGMALGFDTGLVFNRSIQEHKLKLMPGDKIILYTDGVVEAKNRRQEMYGENRFFKFVKEMQDASSKELLMELKEELTDFRRGAEPSDDVTLLALQVKR